MKNKKIVAFVPIKENSVRLKNKNFRLLGEKPLYFHIYNTLTHTPSIESVYLYTSEPLESFDLPSGVKYIGKDPENSEDSESAISLIQDFCNKVDSDLYLLAHATTPFTTCKTIERAIDKVISEKFDSALTVERINTFAWYDYKTLNYNINSVPKTQNLQPVIIETSGFYLFSKSLALNDSRRIGYNPYFCVVECPETIDIDYNWQFHMAELYSSTD